MSLLAGDLAYPRPDWFERALAQVPETGFVAVDGVDIEMLAWGRRGAPGLLLVHGYGAHAHWWAFIAPFLADRFRVASLSFSGMGRSGWRDAYPAALYAREILAVAEAAGLDLSGQPPALVGHSYGGAVAVTALAGNPGRFSRAVIVDSGLLSPKYRARQASGETMRPHRVYPDLDSALRRFRFLPEQGTDNLFIADYIARQSLKPVAGGWTWRFDPNLGTNRSMEDLAPLLARLDCPLGFIRGGDSTVLSPEEFAAIRALQPNAQAREIEGAAHHVMVDRPLHLIEALDAMLAG